MTFLALKAIVADTWKIDVQVGQSSGDYRYANVRGGQGV